MENSADVPENWQFGINDPTLIAWTIFVVYFIAVYFCWRASTTELSRSQSAVRWIWRVLALLLVGLGLNKQLDLHQLVLQVLRSDAFKQNVIGIAAIVLVAVAAIAVMVYRVKGLTAVHVAELLSRSNRKLLWAVGIFAALLVIQVVRFLPGPIADLLVTHVFTEEEGLMHIHIVEVIELVSLIAIIRFAR